MFTKKFQAFWAIQRQSALVNQLNRGGVPYQDIKYIYNGDFLYGTNPPGLYYIMATGSDAYPWPDELPAPLSGAIGVDRYANGGAAGFCSGPLIERVDFVINRDVPANYSEYILFDREDWDPYWRKDYRIDPIDNPDNPNMPIIPRNQGGSTVESHWRRYITEERRDEVLGDITPYSLAAEQKYIDSYIAVARLHHDAIFQRIRQLRPNAKIGQYGKPDRQFYQIGPDHRERPWILEANLAYIPRMARNWDYLSPWLYPAFRVLADGEPAGPGGGFPISDWAYYLDRMCREYLRMQGYCEGKPIICHIGPFHDVPDNQPLFDIPLNETTARLQVQYCRLFGFDGVIMWGSIPVETPTPNPQREQEIFDRLQIGLSLMQPYLRSFVDSTSQGAVLSTNSPIGIGIIQ